MKKTEQKYQAFVQILKEELIPAMGCTEPISLAYGASIARKVLNHLPTKIVVEASGSIIKNVKSVIVPHTHHLKGIKAAVCAGIIGGNDDKYLEVLSQIDEKTKKEIDQYIEKVDFEEHFLDSSKVFDYIITVWNKKEYVKVRISDSHMHVVCIEKNGQILQEEKSVVKKEKADRSLLDIKDIYDFIKTVELTDIQDILERQIDYNYAIACAGLNDNYGANIGKVLLKSFGNDVKNKAKAYAAAGSDARMNGCELPVVINSGSGNQGMTCSLPVIIYAQELKVSKEKMFRALALSNLVAIHEKSGIGTLSAYCGAVSAATGVGAGIAYLYDEDYQAVIHTIVNTLANVSGIVCDGAKASCAAKIASSVDAAILGYHMYKNGQEFKSGDGLVMENVEATIQSVGRLGREGMRETNKEIIKMMIHE